MSNNSNNNTTSGVSFLGLLAIAFIVLKLVGVIHWNWAFVLAPIWVPIVVVFVVVLIIVLRTDKIKKL